MNKIKIASSLLKPLPVNMGFLLSFGGLALEETSGY
jgi:hypothetical protein